jgi:predicted metal-dependent phosphotriesterase family hydrolase
MATITTVLGPIKPEELGTCLPHEHIWCDQNLGPRRSLMATMRDPATFMKLDDFNRMTSELKAYKAAGGNAIVDVTCNGWGRDLDVLARLSEAAEVHIIATSGFYIEPHIPYFVDAMSVEALADYISREVEDQVGNTRRRCGLFKSAIHRARVEGIELKVLQAIALAQKRTGAAITSHTTGSRRMEMIGGVAGVHQLEILKEEGVDPTRFIVGHVDERPDIDILSSLASQGCYIQFDVIGKEHYLLDQTRAELIHALIERGYLSQLMISQDRNRNHEMRYMGNTGYCHIFETFLPRLRKLGVTKEQVKTIMVHNPATALSII